MLNVLFIGNRPKVFEEITKSESLRLVHIFALENSLLHDELKNSEYEYRSYGIKEKENIIREISELEFDILISSGCPFIIPVSKIKKPHQLFINTHPSFLPDLAGCHPANGALLYERNFTGATMHYMDDDIDTGNIIHQAKVDITSDIDLGLLYQITFDLEANVFSKGMNIIINANLNYEGKKQTGNRSYYTRSAKDMILEICKMPEEELVARIRAFGIKSQGALCFIDNLTYKIFDAEIISNPYLLDKYSDYLCGSLLMKYDDKLLVKTRDGIINFKSYNIL